MITKRVKADSAGLAQAAAVLSAGGLAALPTETVYGLAARADRADAVAKIYTAKGRPSFNPLIVHVRDLDQAAHYADFNPTARRLAEQYWPGPLTLVLPALSVLPGLSSNRLAPAITAGLPTIALRSPSHRAVQHLLEMVDFPIAAPSANRSGFISPTSCAHVLATLDGKIDLVVDGGATSAGVESTILAVRPDGAIEELRSGPISLPDISKRLGAGGAIEAPGQLASHYAPGKPLRLNALKVAPDEFFIGFGAINGDCTLSGDADLDQAAARLYDCLHLAAASDKPKIAVAPVPAVDIGIAINDRLSRAAIAE